MLTSAGRPMIVRSGLDCPVSAASAGNGAAVSNALYLFEISALQFISREL